MANVWKIGSRWSDYGASNSSIISIFRRNSVVFVGEENARNRFVNQVEKGDYFAIADGYNVIAVAKAIDSPKLLKDIHIKTTPNDNCFFDYEECKDWAVGVRVKIVDLEESDCIWYEKMGTFFLANKIWNQVIDLYNNHDRKFSIKSNTYSLLQEDNDCNVLLGKTRYIIPVFQRPYSWSETQLEPFVNDIFKGYWGSEKNIALQEPMFIGTMQLSEKKFISSQEFEQEVIDGQQRISTITIFLKILQLKYQDCERLKKLNIDWLETRVNSGTQNEYLAEFLYMQNIEDLLSIREGQNKYISNANLVFNYFEENIQSDECENSYFDIDGFVNYLFSKIYFVVIETYAGISKTIQIFNTINTTGLDLNGGDLFKIRMYEYLRDKKQQDETVFEQISELYRYIDDRNSEHGVEVTNIIEILGIYKDYLISKYDLPDVLFTYGTETFFERLFDKILEINNWEHFSKVTNDDFQLHLEEIRCFIEVRFTWASSEYISAENMFALRLLWWSRYGRYWRIVYQLLYKYRNDPDVKIKLSETLILINKISFIYSVRYAKSVYRTHSFMQAAMKIAVNNDYDSFVEYLTDKITTKCNKDHTRYELSGYITDNAKKKNLICCMVAYLDEITIDQDIERINETLFETKFDIEHIHATADNSIQVDDILQNSIGNLAMLEEDINRSISDDVFLDKRKRYSDSKYYSIRKLIDVDEWTEREIKENQKRNVDAIIDYLFK
ncbi:MAG: DUF262 domain-containing protein [Proteocatella sp.]